MTESIFIAKAGESNLSILSSMANRHGLIAGATGTGKTVTLQSLAEGFSRAGVPVFLSDVKGDLSGMCRAGELESKAAERYKQLGLGEFQPAACPVVFWDVFGDKGHPVRATLAEMGPLLLSRMLGLNDVQSGVINAVFRIADDQGWLMLDLKDLRAMMQHVAENAADYATAYGNISKASVGAIQRALLQLESQGADRLFGEPALDLRDFMRTDAEGRGVINILAADVLYNSPGVYATLLLWLLSELFEQLPEVGDVDRPKLVFFFDEAHLLFADAPKALMDKIEQVVRLIRSKGVGVYFVSQNPLDIPDIVLGQLGNRVQHALRAFTPRDQKAVKAAAQTFRENPALDVETAIAELEVGEALVSFLDKKGIPRPVERGMVCPPSSRIGPADPSERLETIANSPLHGRYENAVDRESAYEILKGRAQASAEQQSGGGGFDWGGIFDDLAGGGSATRKKSAGRRTDGVIEAAAKSAMRSMGNELGRQLARGLLGSLLGKRR